MRKPRFSKRKLNSLLTNNLLLLYRTLLVLIALFIFAWLYSSFFANRETFVSPLSKIAPNKSNIIQNTQEIEDLLKRQSIPVSTVLTATDSSFLVRLKTEEEVYFSKKKDVNHQVSSLQLILSRFTIEGKKVKSIDFRFDKPVVIFK